MWYFCSVIVTDYQFKQYFIKIKVKSSNNTVFYDFLRVNIGFIRTVLQKNNAFSGGFSGNMILHNQLNTEALKVTVEFVVQPAGPER